MRPEPPAHYRRSWLERPAFQRLISPPVRMILEHECQMVPIEVVEPLGPGDLAEEAAHLARLELVEAEGAHARRVEDVAAGPR